MQAHNNTTNDLTKNDLTNEINELTNRVDKLHLQQHITFDERDAHGHTCDNKPIETNRNTTACKKSDTLSKKEQRKRATLYWGIELQPEDIFENEIIKSVLETNKELIPLKRIHSTLLFVGKRNDVREEVFYPLENKTCTLTINAYGISCNALSLRVSSIVYDNELIMHSYPNKQQHITLALKPGVPAKDSVLTLVGEGDVIDFNLIVRGHVKRYMY